MISILVPWRSDDPKRIRVWDHVRPLWEALDCELIICDDGAESGPFARARAYNLGFPKASGEVVVTFGANHLPNLEAAELAATIARSAGWSRVCNRAAMYGPENTDRILEGETPEEIKAPVHEDDIAGIIAIHRDAWAEVGGYDERFGTGYGYEDVAFRIALAREYGYTFGLDGTLHILDHGNGGLNRISQVNHELFWGEYARIPPRENVRFIK